MNMTHEQLHEAADYLETKEGGLPTPLHWLTTEQTATTNAS
jgi:hypothetical protein